MLKSTLNATAYIIEMSLKDYPNQKSDLEFLRSLLHRISKRLAPEEELEHTRK